MGRLGATFTAETPRPGAELLVNEAQERFVNSLRLFGKLTAALALIISLAALVGWTFNIDAAKSIIPGLTAMNPVAAVAFLLAVTSLWLRKRDESSWRDWVALLCAVIVFAIGCVRVIGCFQPGLDIGVDKLLFSGSVAQHRMAPNAAVTLLLAGLGLCLIDRPLIRGLKLAQASAILVGLVSLTAVLGYAYHVPAFYTIGSFVPMGMPTAMASLMLSISILAIRPDQGLVAVLCHQSPGGVMVRRLLPPALLAPMFFGYLQLLGEKAGLFSFQTGMATFVFVSTVICVAMICRSAVLLNRLDHDRCETERHLKKAKIAAEAAHEVKGAFLANISHEIRTPLTAILGFADLYFKPSKTQHERNDCVQTIRRNGDHLLTIINDILDLSKIEAGKMRVERVTCSPGQVVSEVASMLRAGALEKNLSLEVQFEGPVPQSIRTDPTRLRQALINLLGNAIKFTEKGGVRIVTSMKTENTHINPKLQISVIDTGIGIAPDKLSNLFKPFEQADISTSRTFGGTGLGLSIGRHLASLLGGDITVNSEPGKGSTFSLVIETGPLSGVPMLYGEQVLSTQTIFEPPSIDDIKISGSILVAEDGIENQRLIVSILQEAGAKVQVANNGQIAHDLAMEAFRKRQPFDLIFMDMQMPVLDGFQATTQLREKGYNRPIIALTANAVARDRCLNAGCNDFLDKPIDVERLLMTAARHIQNAQSIRPSIFSANAA